jgi:hypothetical protein
MATSTYKSFLMHKNEASYEKLVDISGYPDLGGKPEQIDVTTLSDKMNVYVDGIQKLEALEFDAFYDLASYKALKALEGKDDDYSVWFGGTEDTDGTVTPTGSEGKFDFKGSLSVYVTSGDVNAARKIKITITPSKAISLSE